MLIDFLVLSLATWRLSSLIATPGDDGPWEMFLRIRKFVGVKHDEQTGLYYGTNEFAKGIMCLWCVSVWVGLGLAVLYFFFREPVVLCSLPFALSGAAVIVERITNG
jgi:hypothetical protein